MKKATIINLTRLLGSPSSGVSVSLLLLMLGVATGCDMQEDRRICPVQGALELSYDWANVPTSDQSPDALRLHLYHQEGAHQPYNTDNKGDRFDLDRGFYTILAYNTDDPTIRFVGMEQGAESGYVEVPQLAQTPIVPNHPYDKNEGTATKAIHFDGQPYIEQPSKLYGVTHTQGNVFIEVGKVTPLTIAPLNHLRQALIQAKINGDFGEITECVFEISGVVQSLRLHDRAFTGDPATILETGTRTEQGYSAIFTLLGKHEAVPSNILVHIHCQSDTHYDFVIDITEALKRINEQGVISSTITINFNVADKHEMVYELELVGWEHQEGGNLDINFNE